jgi:hypothetical protein
MSRRVGGIALAVAAALALIVRPGLALYMAIGAAPGLLLLSVSRFRDATVRSAEFRKRARAPLAASARRSASPLATVILVIALGAAGLGVVAVQIQSKAGSELGVTGPRALPLSATFVARARVRSGHAGMIDEQLEIQEKALRHLEGRHQLSARMLDHQLGEHGWHRTVSSAELTLQFVRSQPEDWKFAGILPRQTKNQVAAPVILLSGAHARFRLLFDGASRVVIEAPTSAVGETYPTATRNGIYEGEEEFTVVLPPLERPVEFELRSAAFRRWPLTYVQSITTWNPFGVLLGTLLPLANKRVRATLARLWQRVRSKPRPEERGA